MKSDKTLVFSNYSDAHQHYIYIYLKDYGLFILEDRLKENEMLVRARHWEEVLGKIEQGMLVATRNEALYQESIPTKRIDILAEDTERQNTTNKMYDSVPTVFLGRTIG